MSDARVGMAPEGVPEQREDLLGTTDAGPAAIRGSAIRMAAIGATVLISVGASALLYRHLGVTRTGHYMTIVALVTLCGGLTDAGLQAIGVRALATRDAAERFQFMRSLGGLRLALALGGVMIAVVFALAVGYSATLVLGTLIYGIAMILIVLQDTYSINLIAGMRNTWVAAAELLRILVMTIAIVALVAAGAGLLPFYAASIPAALAVVCLTGWLVHREAPLLPSINLPAWRRLLGDTISFSLATAVTAAYYRIAIVVVSLVSTAHQTGYFSVSYRVIEVLFSLPVTLVGVAFPIFARAARDDPARLSYAVGRVFDTLWILALACALGLVVGAPVIIKIIAGPRFTESITVLRIQGISVVATFVGAVCGYTLLSLHRHRQILIASLGALVLTVTLTGVLGAVDGARGAAIGTTLSEFALVVMLASAVYSSGLRPAVTPHAFVRSLLAVALGAATLAIPGLPDVAKLVLALVIYGTLLLLLRAVPDEILAVLPRPLGSRPAAR